MKLPFHKKDAAPVEEHSTELTGQPDIPEASVILEAPEPPAQAGAYLRNRRIPLTHRVWAKVTAFILCILMVALTAGSCLGIIFLLDEEIYTNPREEYLQNAFSNLAEGVAARVTAQVLAGDLAGAEEYCQYRNVTGVAISGVTSWRWGDVSESEHQTGYTSWWLYEDGGLYSDGPTKERPYVHNRITVTVYVPRTLTAQDEFLLAEWVINLAYQLRYWVFVIGGGAAVLAVACFVFLMCASGRRDGLPNPQPGWGTRLPFDLLTAGVVAAGAALIAVMSGALFFQSDVKTVAAFLLCGVGLLILLLGWCMSFALRIKLGGWWENSVIWRALKLGWSILRSVVRWLGRVAGGMAGGIAGLLKKLPLVWKTAVGILLIAALELYVMVFSWGMWDVHFWFWLLKTLILGSAVLFIALTLRRLQKGGEEIAAGDLSYQVDTRRMPPAFKQHGENLNRIGEGMTAAVEQRMKSERMKTELITNVSHDIKTPLTSIINYAGLIEREECDNPKITEYAEVLHRQSERLKRLIEDLVEASKASTGNLEVNLAPCEVGVLLTQTAGEYAQRLAQSRLELVTSQPEKPVRILADGRRLWRVFDNLMNNICKYAMAGTRVYLTLEQTAGQAVISLKNISREPLDMSADELLERFVRGDSARTSEGNGLGLSIAKSLTELQKGRMEVTVDGDLFKVILRFPTLG